MQDGTCRKEVRIMMLEQLQNVLDCAEVDFKNGYIKNTEDVFDYVRQMYDDACTYTRDCYDICLNAGKTDFSDFIESYGASSISDFAYHTLVEEGEAEDIVGKAIEILEKYTCEECGEHITECSCE